MNETHEPSLRSWVQSANEPGTDFPIQNLPLGVFRRRDAGADAPRVGIAIGAMILDVAACSEAQLFTGAAAEAASVAAEGTLNGLMTLGNSGASALRAEVSRLLADGSAARARVAPHLVPATDAAMQLPARIGDYTDFYASIWHATNVGSMFRPDNPLLPNYKYVPIGYHGRASSIVVSGTPVRRPLGQTRPPDAAEPSLGPSRSLDYEMEVGCFVGRGNEQGSRIPIVTADEQIFGFCLVNDWSARDVQTWEYQPLGPFLAKNFATTISPWVVTSEALAPFRVPASERGDGDPAPLPYLSDPRDQREGGIAITLEVWLQSATMRQRGSAPMLVSRGSFCDMYWTVAQLVAHHASNGCNLEPGDLLASGTVSGATEDSRGCLLERTWRGTQPLTLPSGEQRRFLEDGDEVIMRGYCERDGYARIGFGECRGIIQPAAA